MFADLWISSSSLALRHKDYCCHQPSFCDEHVCVLTFYFRPSSCTSSLRQSFVRRCHCVLPVGSMSAGNDDEFRYYRCFFFPPSNRKMHHLYKPDNGLLWANILQAEENVEGKLSVCNIRITLFVICVHYQQEGWLSSSVFQQLLAWTVCFGILFKYTYIFFF